LDMVCGSGNGNDNGHAIILISCIVMIEYSFYKMVQQQNGAVLEYVD